MILPRKKALLTELFCDPSALRRTLENKPREKKEFLDEFHDLLMISKERVCNCVI
jgi:hypothetical protein